MMMQGDRLPRVSAQLRAISIEYSFAELAASTLNWHSSRKLGSGSYGAVFKGELQDGTEVAIKVIDLKALGMAGQAPEMAGFEEEVTMLSKFRHPNLVTLLGFGKHEHSRYLIYELLSGGDAFQRIQKSKQVSRQEPFFWFERLSVCLDSATGLSHMHNSKPKAFHRDIKAANILLDRHGTAKMADFGLSLTSSRSDALHVTVKNICGTPGYACPIYSRTGRVSEGSEVYSAGMVFIELLTSLPPAMGDPSRLGGISYPVGEIIQPNTPGALDRCLRQLDPTAMWPLPLAKELAEYSLRMVNAHDESVRPPFAEIVRTIRRMMERYPRPAQGVPPPLPTPASPRSKQQGTPGYPGGAHGAATPPASGSGKAAQQQRPSSPRIAGGGASNTGERMENRCLALELVRGAGVDAASVPLNRRRLFFAPPGDGEDSSAFVASIGRQHQPEFFEAWLPDTTFRNCISRTTFDISRAGRQLQLVARGANPLVVDGRVVTRTASSPVNIGSEIAFSQSQATSAEISAFLVLRIVCVQPGEQDAHPTASLPSNAAAGAGRRLPSPGGQWYLECAYAEGMSTEQLQALPTESRLVKLEPATIAATDSSNVESSSTTSTTVVGRTHQPTLFETVLVSAPSRLSLISRSHVQLEVQQNGTVCAKNLSSNPLYIDQVVLAKNDSRVMAPDSMLSFARLEAKAHVHFLSLKLIKRPLVGTVGRERASTAVPATGSTPPVTPRGTGESEADAKEQSLRAAQEKEMRERELKALQEERERERKALEQERRLLQEQQQALQDKQQALKEQERIAEMERSALEAQREQERKAAELEWKARKEQERTSLEEERLALEARKARDEEERKAFLDMKEAKQSQEKAAERQLERATVRVRRDDMNSLSAKSEAPSPIMLELHGEGVLDLPLSNRTVGPVSLQTAPLIVGRRHQVELHREAITKECLQFLSRDHFRIELEGNNMMLVALTSNPIWRDRDGVEPVELSQGDAVKVAVGDRIALGTGAESSNAIPEVALQKLCWHIRPGDIDGVPSASGDGSGSPPSPGGSGPRVSNIAPWGQQRSHGSAWDPAPVAKHPSERPSEAFEPAPQLLSAGRDSSDNAASLPCFGGALRAPVALEGLVEADAQAERGALDMSAAGGTGHDEFARSGFRY